MLLNRDTWPQHRRWVFFVLLSTALLSFSYLLYIRVYTDPINGGTLPGLVYGSLALGIMIFDSLLGGRKKAPSLRVGRMSTWLKGHVWISLLLFPLIFFHSGFRVGGLLTLIVWILFLLVMVSGIFGILLQNIIPQLMTDTVPMETIYDQIGHVMNQLRYDADVRVTQQIGSLGFDLIPPEGITAVKIKDVVPLAGSEEVKNFYLRSVRPLLDPQIKLQRFLRTRQEIEDLMKSVRPTIPASFHVLFDQLVPVLEEKRQLELQKLLHHWLHGWLFVHVPISFTLLLLVVVHSITALWF